MKRGNVLQIKFTDEERQKIKWVAKRRGLKEGSLLRTLALQEYEAMQPDAPAHRVHRVLPVTVVQDGH